MRTERIPLVGSTAESSFYNKDEGSSGEPGTSGISRRILYGLTILSVLVACGCSIYGTVQSKSFFILFPFSVVILWLVIHCFLIFFLRGEQHDFNPPAWFLFVSSGHIFIQSLVVIILTLFKQ